MIAPKPFDTSIDRSQVKQQLALLGYKRGSTIYLRAFFHSSDTRTAGDKGRKAEAKNLDQLIEIAQKWQTEGRGVYFVVNNGGHSDKDVTQCRAIFYEHDDLDKEISKELWCSLGLPDPTFQVDTGGKSIHSYWVFSEPVDAALWKALQTDLLEYADADRALKNPSRVMRLAGAYHISPNGAFPSVIVAASGTKYSFDELRAIIPTPRKEVLPSVSPMTTDMDIPLSECLRVVDRDFIANGEREGRRNDTGAALARNLIGTAARLQYLGESYSGDPRQLFDNYCNRCTPPLDVKEADQIWKSAQGDNPTATLTDDAIANCVKSWRRRQQAIIQNTTPSKVTQLKAAVEVSLPQRISEILCRGLKSSEEKAALLELGKQTSTPSKDIEAIANLLRSDLEIEESRDERKQEITELLAVSSDKSLDLVNFLPQQLADPLKLWCKWLNIPQSVALTAILTTASTLHPVGTELVIHRGMDFSVPPILFSAVVGESGQKKSPVYRTLIKKPLRVLQNEAKQEHQRQMVQYEIDLAEWEKAPGENSKPEKPGLPIYFFTDATGEGIKTQAQETPDKAMFALIDELAGLFNSSNQYRGGKGSDKQDTLSYYDGLGQTVLRASGIKVDVERIYLSIFGGIQPEILKEHTKDLKDADGHWARFLFVNQPLAASILPEDESSIDLKELLSGYYRRIAMIPKLEYKLSRAAFKRYQIVYNELELKRVSHPQPGMRAVYSKMEGAIARLALNLHVVTCAVNNAVNTEISLETMNQAIALSEFYINQVKAIHADSKADKGELSAVLAKVFKLALSKGELSATTANQGVFAIKNNSHAVDCFRELEAMGYGKVEKKGKSWFFYPRIDEIDGRIDGRIDELKISKQRNINTSETQNSRIDRIDGIDDFSKKESSTSSTGLDSLKSTNAPNNAKNTENLYSIYSIYDAPETLTDKGIDRIDETIDDSSINIYDCNKTIYDVNKDGSDGSSTPVADGIDPRIDGIDAVVDEPSIPSTIPVEDDEVDSLDFQKSLKVGDRVTWTGDAYDGAAGAAGEIIGFIFSDFEVKWTRSDKTSFKRREDLADLLKL